jgi:hypothetical protein
MGPGLERHSAGLGADFGVCTEGTRSSSRLTPVAMATGAAMRELVRLLVAGGGLR